MVITSFSNNHVAFQYPQERAKTRTERVRTRSWNAIVNFVQERAKTRTERVWNAIGTRTNKICDGTRLNAYGTRIFYK